MMMKWINIFEEEPRDSGDVLFVYDDEIHVGICLDLIQKPRKKTWKCDCHDKTYLLDVIPYEEDESLFIQWWLSIPEYPEHRKLP